MADNPWGGSASSSSPRGREWDVLEKVVMSSLEEQRRARRWGVFFKLLTFAYLILLLWLMLGRSGISGATISAEHTAMVDVRGQIADGADADAAQIMEGLRAAFEAPHSKAVLLRINSPGGSPVQSAYVYDELRRLRALHPKKKVYAVITDMGGQWCLLHGARPTRSTWRKAAWSARLASSCRALACRA